MSYVLKVLHLAGVLLNPDHVLDGSEEGSYVQSFDPDAHGGFGDAVFTHDITQAKTFDDAIEAFKFYRAQSTVRPIRPDGHANRPLMAFTMEVVKYDPA